jgi:16S rRNA (cytosine967-C5)-methyltransferase
MISPARQAAFDALRFIASGQADLGDALRRTRDPLKDPRDRALATDLVLGTLRTRTALDYQLQQFSARPLARLDELVLNCLRLAAYQILYLSRLPMSAVVNDAVSMVKASKVRSAAPFANAVLRRLARSHDHLNWPSRPSLSNREEHRSALAEFLSITCSHPPWLVNRWLERYGETVTEQWLRFNNQAPAMTLATNRLRTTRNELATRLLAEDVRTVPTAFAANGLTVVSGHVLRTQTFREGYCLVQDEASQLVAELVDGQGARSVLDACASPGGKTVALAAQVGMTVDMAVERTRQRTVASAFRRKEGRVVATDVRRRRVRLLAETLRRCQALSVQVVQVSATDPLPFVEGVFDRVLVDAPCSGLGTVRRDPDIRWRRTESDLPAFSQQQQDLLRRVAPTVSAGGRIVYSTCSSEPEENEGVVSAFLADHSDFNVLPIASLPELSAAVRSLTTSAGFFRSQPTVGLEAFFAAVLQKRAVETERM